MARYEVPIMATEVNNLIWKGYNKAKDASTQTGVCRMRSRQAELDARQAFGTQNFHDGHVSNNHRALKSRSPGKTFEREVIKRAIKVV